MDTIGFYRENAIAIENEATDYLTLYRSDGVTLIGFDSFLQITLVVETLSF